MIRRLKPILLVREEFSESLSSRYLTTRSSSIAHARAPTQFCHKDAMWRSFDIWSVDKGPACATLASLAS